MLPWFLVHQNLGHCCSARWFASPVRDVQSNRLIPPSINDTWKATTPAARGPASSEPYAVQPCRVCPKPDHIYWTSPALPNVPFCGIGNRSLRILLLVPNTKGLERAGYWANTPQSGQRFLACSTPPYFTRFGGSFLSRERIMKGKNPRPSSAGRPVQSTWMDHAHSRASSS